MMRLRTVHKKQRNKLKSLISNPRPTKVYLQNVLEAAPVIPDGTHSEIQISDSIDDDEPVGIMDYDNNNDDDDDNNDNDDDERHGDCDDVVEFDRDNCENELEEQYEDTYSGDMVKERKRQSGTPMRKLEGVASAQFDEAGIYKHFKTPVGGKRDEGNTKDMVMRCIRLLIWLHFTIHGEQIDLETLSIIEFFTIFVKR